jgi:hypothetical protein
MQFETPAMLIREPFWQTHQSLCRQLRMDNDPGPFWNGGLDLNRLNSSCGAGLQRRGKPCQLRSVYNCSGTVDAHDERDRQPTTRCTCCNRFAPLCQLAHGRMAVALAHNDARLRRRSKPFDDSGNASVGTLRNASQKPITSMVSTLLLA